jgi:hypothetical protein
MGMRIKVVIMGIGGKYPNQLVAEVWTGREALLATRIASEARCSGVSLHGEILGGEFPQWGYVEGNITTLSGEHSLESASNIFQELADRNV